MRKVLFIILLSYVFGINAQIQHVGFPVGKVEISNKSANLSKPALVEMPSFEQTEEEQNLMSKTLKFAHPFEVALNPENSGRWSTLDNGNKVWHLSIHSEGASSINLIFDQFRLPKGASLFIYNNDMSHVIGAFTSANNKSSGILPTLPVKGEEITIEYQEPANAEFPAELQIGQVNHDYTTIFNREKVGYFGDSQSCEKDVTCYIDDIYKKTRRSTVKIIINGSELMTGTLVNNTREDGTPYILTAAHGFENYDLSAEKSLFIFNYQVPLCFTDVEGTREQSVAGGTIVSYSPKVNNEALDFALVKMSVKPPTAYRAYYAGWNRSTTSPDYSFCIHHPQGDVKKISFDDNALSKKTLNANSISYYPNGHWRVYSWEVGVTEGGSSGSGIFNPQGQVIGGLSAGSATCSSPYNDYYYRFDLAWNTYEANDRQLAHWLDPDSTDISEISAYEPSNVNKTKRLTHIHDSSDVTVAKNTTIGNIAGNNNVGITHFVEKFENSGQKQILGFYFVASDGDPASTVNTTIWHGHELPETEIYSEPLLIKNWTYSSYVPWGAIGGTYPKDSLSMQENFVYFPEPITVNGNYFIGFEVNNDADTPDFGLLLSHQNSADNAYYYDTQWRSYTQLADYNKATTLWIDPVVQNDTTTSLKQITHTPKLKVYPNPVSNGELLTIESNEMPQQICIYDFLGRPMPFTISNTTDNKTQLNISKLSSGIYIVSANRQHVIFEKK